MAVITADPNGIPPWSRRRRIADYSGAPDKTDNESEHPFPHAWTWYSEIVAARGSAYRRDRQGLVHAETIALARSECGRTRASEKLAFNRFPLTSWERLSYWVDVLAIPIRPTDSLHDIRVRAAAKFQAAVGPTIFNENTAVERLLESLLQQVYRQEGVALAAPPPQTFWPGVNPGPAAYSLAPMATPWLSERAHLVVSTTPIPPDLTLSEFLELVNVYLFDLLDRMLPAWATFNWAVDVQTGFVLDVSQLDFAGFNP